MNNKIFMVFLIFLLWILFLKITYPQKTYGEIFSIFKMQVIEIIKFLFESIIPSKQRYCFDEFLKSEFENVISQYSNNGFQPICRCELDKNVPCILIRFVPNKRYSDEELKDISNLVLLKFKKYLYAANLQWENFAHIFQHKTEITVHIYYAEFPEDKSFFQMKKKMLERYDMDLTPEIVIDEELESEIQNVS